MDRNDQFKTKQRKHMNYFKLIWILCIAGTATAQILVAQQNATGVRFTENTSWSQVLARAKAESKYIFVDCYATWCGPCKKMDTDVYPLPQLGSAMNDKFISVKVQMDTTAKDNQEVQSWYDDAHRLMKNYSILAFPTYLFFSPDGKIVHKDLGFKKAEDFIKLTTEAMDPAKQYYILVEQYKQGNKNPASMRALALAAKTLGNRELASRVASDYKNGYLDGLTDEQRCTRDHLQFIADFYDLVRADDGFFALSYRQPQKVDELLMTINPLFKGYSGRLVNHVITKEEIDARLWKGNAPITKKPNWKTIYDAISKKYSSSYAEDLMPNAKLNFYRKIEDWNTYAHLKDEFIKKNPPKTKAQETSGFGDAWGLNGAAWDVFLHCNDQKIMKLALDWSELSIRLEEPDPNIQFLDTKANLLYKLGRVAEAIEWEQKAIDTGIAAAKKKGSNKGYFFDEYSAIIAKMKRGEPTWPVKK
jgi:thiol-disulfide isomerase/thioredoxin